MPIVAQDISERSITMSKILISLFLLMTMGFAGCMTTIPETAEDDGGVKKYNSGEDYPKTIDSTEITSFVCEFSLIAAALEEESELDGRVYSLNAVLKNEAVECVIEWYNRFGENEKHEFTSDLSFMASLQKIISEYNFASLNGYSCRVSGLPDMYGAKLDILYESGESIYAYDNQDCFISFEAMKSLIELFTPPENK